MRTKAVEIPGPSVSPQLRNYLYFSAAITGGAIMIIEILGAKMLAPFVGTSHFVWTAQIAVTLVALACGYYAGGKLADRSPKLSWIYGCVLAAGIYLAVTLILVKPVAYWALQFDLALGSLLASAFLFFIPLSLLAMVGPFFVRVLTSTVYSVGGNIGRLTAVSTLGSFVGTLLIGYLLIPYLPNSVTMLSTAALLMVVVGVYFLLWGRKEANGVGLVIGMILALLAGYGAIRKERMEQLANLVERYRANSNFGLLQVVETKDGGRRIYLNDFLMQNTYDPAEKKSLSVFTYALHDLAVAYTPKIEKALCIGLGVGIVPMQFAREGVEVDVVEINPAVVPVATKFFDCDISKVRLAIGDGRYFVKQAGKEYDTIVLDAFLGDSSPSHLMSKEAFTDMARILAPDGTLVINSFGDFRPGRDFFVSSLHQTLRTVFQQVRIHVPGNGNVFFVASKRPQLEILHEPSFDHVHIACRTTAREVFLNRRDTLPENGTVLTDDYNPVEFFDAEFREEHRKQLALHFRPL